MYSLYSKLIILLNNTVPEVTRFPSSTVVYIPEGSSNTSLSINILEFNLSTVEWIYDDTAVITDRSTFFRRSKISKPNGTTESLQFTNFRKSAHEGEYTVIVRGEGKIVVVSIWQVMAASKCAKLWVLKNIHN